MLKVAANMVRIVINDIISYHYNHTITVDFLTEYGVRADAPQVIPACPSRPQGPQDIAYSITASDYDSIAGADLLGNSFPSSWCILATVKCNVSQAGHLLYYEDDKGFGFSMDISGGRLSFNLRDGNFSEAKQLCDNAWNQFSVCYNGGTLVMTTDCTDAVILGRSGDPSLSTSDGELTIFTHGTSDYSVSQLLVLQ